MHDRESVYETSAIFTIINKNIYGLLFIKSTKPRWPQSLLRDSKNQSLEHFDWKGFLQGVWSSAS